MTDLNQYDGTVIEATVAPEPPAALSSVITTDPEHADVPYWFATKQGWLQNVPTLFGVAHIKSEKWPIGLPAIEQSFILSDERIPKFIFDQATDFFRKIYDEHKTEATTYICRDSEGQYSLFVPTQYVTGASVNHKVEPGEMGTRYPVGTIHSHCNFGAFHSGTDEHDMGKMPGIHATIGYVVRDEPEMAIAIAVGNGRWTVEYGQIVDDTKTHDQNGYNTAQPRWLTFVHPNTPAPWQSKGITTSYTKPTTLAKQYGRPPSYQNGWGHWQKDWADWDDEKWRKPTSDTLTEEDWMNQLVEEVQGDLARAAIDLAENGYRLQYTITHDPVAAKRWLAELDNKPTTVDLWED